MNNFHTTLHCGKAYKVQGRKVCPHCTKLGKNLTNNDPLGSSDLIEVKNPVFLVKRINKKTNDWFYGCPNFPKCKYSENRPLTRKEKDIKVWAWANSLCGY